jgi:hypothetical protein
VRHEAPTDVSVVPDAMEVRGAPRDTVDEFVPRIAAE